MIRQESNFNPNASRYEPFYDQMYIQDNESFNNSTHRVNAGQTIYDFYLSNTNAYPQRLWPRNVRQTYNNLLSTQGQQSADNYLRNYLNYGRGDGSNPPEGTEAGIAQTRIATSYGLLQVMYPTALLRGFLRDRAPEDLRDPYTSIDLGVNYLVQGFRDTGSWDTDWNNALLRYNGGGNPSYPSDVRRWENSYLPQPVY